MRFSVARAWPLAAVVVAGLMLLNAPAASTQEAAPIRTAAQLPDEVLAQLPSNAAEAGLSYAPRLVEVSVPTREHRDQLVNSGLDVTEHAGDDFVEVVLSDADQEQRLQDLRLDYTVTTPDLIALEHDRILADAAYYQQNDQSGLPSGRTTYRVLADFGEEIDQLAADNPDLAKRISVGVSVEGRDLTGIEIGEDVTAPEDGRPVFLMFGNHHAREWPSAEAPMEFAYDLINTYNAGDERTVDLLSRARVIIVPVSNPDGFDASRTSGDLIDLNPVDGGGTVAILGTPGNAYKRKNCRFAPDQEQPAGGCVAVPSPGGFGVGVDLNRNYGALWGGPGAAGDTPNPDAVETGTSDPTYRGPAPFSEPETQAIRTLISTRQVTTLITNHTFGNLLLRPVGVVPSTIGPDGLPVGYAPDECFTTAEELDNGMQALGSRMASQVGYSNQFGWELYDTTGTTEDYSYNATGGYGYTFEIGPNQFHPPFEEFIAEYVGTSESAQAVTPETLADLTTPSGRNCGEAVQAETLGGGLSEAYYLALEHTADAGTHSVLSGSAPDGAVIGVSRSGQFPLWDGTLVDDTVSTTMTVEGGSFEYHVNPSTRPFVDSRAYFEGEAIGAEVTVVTEEQRTGSTQPPAVGTTDEPIDVPEGIDSLVVHVTAPAPNDYDIELISPDAVVLDSSAGENTDETVEHARPNGIEAGQYVVRILNYAAATDWTMDITLGTLPDSGITEDDLLFTPRTEELWTVTCTIDESVVNTRDVLVDRGQSRNLGEICDPNAVGAVIRLSGPDRFATAIQSSLDRFPEADSAGAVVLARGDDPNGYADALAGGPLAVARQAPLLITNPEALNPAVATEIDRVLPDGGTVYVLGGPAALSPAVEQALVDQGYATVRIQGDDRYATAVAIADELGNPDLVLVATGEAFPDALTASAAAGANAGAVLLTNGSDAHPGTQAYLETHAPAQVLAVGGPAAAAFPAATPVVGADRFQTAVALAETLFDEPTVAGVARGDAFPDALSGGAHIAALGGPMLLTPSAALDGRVAEYLCSQAGLSRLYMYGGTAALAGDVETAAQGIVDGSTCPA